MNKIKFETNLNRAIKNNALTIYMVNRFFKDEKKSLFNNEKIENLVQEHFSELVKGIGKGNVDVLIDTLYEQDSMRKFLESDSTVKYLLDNSTHYDFEALFFESSIKNQAQQYIRNNFDHVIETYSLKHIVSIYKRMPLTKEMKYKIDNYFEKHKEEFLKEILTVNLSIKGQIDDKQMDTLIGLVTKAVVKALKDENCTITDTKNIVGGGFSNVIMIGNTIIKVGLPRKTFNIPNDKRLLQPHLRKDFSKSHGVNAVIEVCDKVDTNITLSDDQLYQIYKDLRERGIVCGDFKYDNVGRLLKDNLPRNSVNNGMIGEVKETLKAGDYVILDTDFIYKEDDPNIELTSDMSRRFERRYQENKVTKSKKL